MSVGAMNFAVNRLNGTTILSFYGELTVQYANEILFALTESIKSSDNLVLNFGGVTDVDLSCLQLLCAAHRSAMRSNKQLSFDVRHNAILRETLSDAGFLEHQGCPFETGVSCPWNG